MAKRTQQRAQEDESAGPIRKERTVTFRTDDEQYEALDQAARSEGDSLGNWCRRNLLRLAGWKYRSDNGATP